MLIDKSTPTGFLCQGKAKFHAPSSMIIPLGSRDSLLFLKRFLFAGCFRRSSKPICPQFSATGGHYLLLGRQERGGDDDHGDLCREATSVGGGGGEVCTNRNCPEDSVNWGIVTRPSSVNHFKGIPRNVVGYSEIGVVQKIGWIHPPTPLTAMS